MIVTLVSLLTPVVIEGRSPVVQVERQAVVQRFGRGFAAGHQVTLIQPIVCPSIRCPPNLPSSIRCHRF